MWKVSFVEWLNSLKRCAEKHSVSLNENDLDNKVFYDNGDTPIGAVRLIQDFGY